MKVGRYAARIAARLLAAPLLAALVAAALLEIDRGARGGLCLDSAWVLNMFSRSFLPPKEFWGESGLWCSRTDVQLRNFGSVQIFAEEYAAGSGVGKTWTIT